MSWAKSEGTRNIMKYMDYQSAASPALRCAYEHPQCVVLLREPRKAFRHSLQGTDNQYPYGHKMQVSHRANADMVTADQGDWRFSDPRRSARSPRLSAPFLGGTLHPGGGRPRRPCAWS